MLNNAIVEAFHATAGLRRREIFLDEQQMPLTALDDARTAAPGWVGQAWSSGTLLVGINPGGGGDEYRRNPSDDQLYDCLGAFRDAEGLEEARSTLERLSTIWVGIQRSHNIWRIIDPILEASGESVEEVAFMNILPFRTRMDKTAPAYVLRASWEKAARPQIAALRPVRVIALGKKAWDVMSRFALPDDAKLILFKRGIGDSYIPAESQIVLESLRADRKKTYGQRR